MLRPRSDHYTTSPAPAYVSQRIGANCTTGRRRCREKSVRYTRGTLQHFTAAFYATARSTMRSTTRCVDTARSAAAATIRRNVSVSPGVASGTGALERGDKGQLISTVFLPLSRRLPPPAVFFSLRPSLPALTSRRCARRSRPHRGENQIFSYIQEDFYYE